jgi:UDP-N-acetylmuramate: L-alanyl-gamma-D-glutamyl-meso-diaminopimelate ligase
MNRHLHILGICGTAMAAIASLARELGWRVTGSDAGIYPPMSDYLAALKIDVNPFDRDNLEPAPDLCLIGNAMSRGNIEVETILNEGLPYLSGPEFIGKYILAGRHPVVVAGTHGKTTTASLMAHVLEHGGHHPGFMIGGIPENFEGGARLGKGPHFVLEGDEYDTAFFDKRSKFLHYRSRTLILNNLEYDHADIFPDLEAIKTQFHHLIRTVPGGGHIIVNADDGNIADVLDEGSWTPLIRFARKGGEEAEWQWEVLDRSGSHFRLWHEDEPACEIEWEIIGRHNVGNACAVMAAATALGLSVATLAEALKSFKGVRRRMTHVGEANGVHIYDDFAHHPTAIRGVVSAMKARIGDNERLWVVVEPRSNTMRSRIHQKVLPGSLRDADLVIFVPPSQRNLDPDEVLDVDTVCRAIGEHATVLPDVEAIIAHVSGEVRSGDHILILSNGSFDGLHHRLLDSLLENDTRP